MFLAYTAPSPSPPLRAALLEALGPAGRQKAESFLHLCPRDSETPLRSLPSLAARLGVGALYLKDEAERLGLNSFKALGGAYAVMALALEQAKKTLKRPLSPADLASPDVCALSAALTVCCATDGNHGRSVAAGAKIAGCRAKIYVHAGVSQSRAAAIAAFGAEIVRTPGSYDDSVALAARDAAAQGWITVSDTAWPGYETIPLTVMQGYTIMAGEAFERLPSPPTHVFLQAGVGGLAAAVAAHAVQFYGADAPKFIVVEPQRAACLFASAKAGRLTSVPHDAPTVMAMLECYTPSLIAWEILSRLATGFVTLPEEAAIAAMRILARPSGDDPVVVSGESGCTGLAGLIACLDDPQARAALKLDSTSRILLFNSEGATDPALYASLIAAPIDHPEV